MDKGSALFPLLHYAEKSQEFFLSSSPILELSVQANTLEEARSSMTRMIVNHLENTKDEALERRLVDLKDFRRPDWTEKPDAFDVWVRVQLRKRPAGPAFRREGRIDTRAFLVESPNFLLFVRPSNTARSSCEFAEFHKGSSQGIRAAIHLQSRFSSLSATAVPLLKIFWGRLACFTVNGEVRVRNPDLSAWLIPKGEFSLLIGQLGLALGLTSESFFSLIGLSVIVTTIIGAVLQGFTEPRPAPSTYPFKGESDEL